MHTTTMALKDSATRTKVADHTIVNLLYADSEFGTVDVVFSYDDIHSPREPWSPTHRTMETANDVGLAALVCGF